MKQITKTKILRKVLVLAFLVVGLVVLESDSSSYASVIPCSEAWVNYYNADNTYYSARLLLFNNNPNSCGQVCASDPNPAQCQQNCQTNRQTALAQAEINLLSASEGTCAPETTNQCAEARYMANQCYIQYDSSGYQGDEEAAISAQYYACIAASKVDMCQ